MYCRRYWIVTIRIGKIIHGDERRATRVESSTLAAEVAGLSASKTHCPPAISPPIGTNRHRTALAAFQSRCLQKVTERDDLEPARARHG